MKFLRKNFKTVAILLGIFTLAAILRFITLEQFPVGFHADEAIIGDTANFIIHTGRGTDGVYLPIYTEVFGDYIPIGYHYLTIPSVLIFGFNVFAVRFPGALLGSLIIFPVYFLSQALFRKKDISLLSAFFVAIAPWAIILSRASSEAAASVFFVLCGFAFFIESFRKSKISYLILGTGILILSYFFYHTPRVFVPLMVLSFFVLMFKEIKHLKDKKYKKFLITSLLLIFGTVIFLVLSFRGSTARFNQLSIFNSAETKLVLEEQIREDGPLSPLITRTFHNKLVNTSLAILDNYFQYLSVDTIFIHSAVPKMFAIPNTGLMYIVLIPPFFYGLYIVLKDRNKISKIVIFWLLIAPVIASLTIDEIPNLRRAYILFPILEMISVIGLIKFIGRFEGKTRLVIITVFSLSMIWCFSYFLHQYFYQAKVHQPWFRYNGYDEAMQVVKENYNMYDKVVVTKAPGGLFGLTLFFMNYNPSKYLSEGGQKDHDYKGFGKFIFVPKECPSREARFVAKKNERTMYLDMGFCKIPKNSSYKDINRQDGSTGFRVVF